MKYCIFFFSITLFSFFFAAHISFAALGTMRSFGGRVISTTTPGITCGAQYGMMSIQPVGVFPATGYTITATTQSVNPGGWILGLYNATPTTGICYTNTAPPIPVPSFNILKFSTSKPSLF
ncbi:MAG: hypothetical protein MUD00_00660 [Candidatus Pacebacteria bacterium]|jgi:hypothetical protein|nr:hypothetical protein [Candidatus Paceibacterota bacterium]